MSRSRFLVLTAVLAATSLSGCASSNAPVDFAALQDRLEAKQAASTQRYPNHSPEQVRVAANAVLNGIDDGFTISLSDRGISAGRAWSSYLVLANLVGWDYWVIHINPQDDGTEVFVNATIRSRTPGLLEAAAPPSNGLMDDIPISSEIGLTAEEMRLFHRRLAAELAGTAAWETCQDAFGAKKGDYPLTCNRGGVTNYF